MVATAGGLLEGETWRLAAAAEHICYGMALAGLVEFKHTIFIALTMCVTLLQAGITYLDCLIPCRNCSLLEATWEAERVCLSLPSHVGNIPFSLSSSLSQSLRKNPSLCGQNSVSLSSPQGLCRWVENRNIGLWCLSLSCSMAILSLPIFPIQSEQTGRQAVTVLLYISLPYMVGMVPLVTLAPDILVVCVSCATLCGYLWATLYTHVTKTLFL